MSIELGAKFSSPTLMPHLNPSVLLVRASVLLVKSTLVGIYLLLLFVCLLCANSNLVNLVGQLQEVAADSEERERFPITSARQDWRFREVSAS